MHPYELKAKDVHSYTVRVLKEHAQIEAHRYCCHTDMFFDILIKASVEGSSVEAACADLEDTADSNTIREYLNQALAANELQQQEERANATLARCIPGALDRASIELAMHFHDEPFYGKQEGTRKFTCSGHAKIGDDSVWVLVSPIRSPACHYHFSRFGLAFLSLKSRPHSGQCLGLSPLGVLSPPGSWTLPHR